MDLGLTDKVIAVAGGAYGIEEGILRILSEESAIVAIVGGNHAENLALQKDLKKSGGRIFCVESALAEPADCEKALEIIVREYGRIDGLVNNAGDSEDNLSLFYLMAHFALPFLKLSGGSVVNISLKMAKAGQVYASANTIAHGGRNALTREWAVELLKYGIRVNAVNISECNTPVSNPSEIAYAVAFLLSEKSSHTTGQVIHLGSGY